MDLIGTQLRDLLALLPSKHTHIVMSDQCSIDISKTALLFGGGKNMSSGIAHLAGIQNAGEVYHFLFDPPIPVYDYDESDRVFVKDKWSYLWMNPFDIEQENEINAFRRHIGSSIIYSTTESRELVVLPRVIPPCAREGSRGCPRLLALVLVCLFVLLVLLYSYGFPLLG